MPFFYELIYKLIKKGFEAIVINRRTISSSWKKDDEIELIYSEVGKIHPGSDCFIIKRSLLERFIQSEACLGALCIMKSLIYNMVALTDKMVIIPDAHATFHIGDDRIWRDPVFREYAIHNENEALKVATNLINISPIYKKRLKAFSLERNEELLFDLVGVDKLDKYYRKTKLLVKSIIKRVIINIYCYFSSLKK